MRMYLTHVQIVNLLSHLSLDVKLVKNADGAHVDNMTDEELIQKANETPYQDWSLISNLVMQTSDEVTIKTLLEIMKAKFREEEYNNDSL